MTSNSFFDTTQSETSEVSSVEGETQSQKGETSAPEHPRLTEIRRLARCDAESQHKNVAVRKLKKGKDKRGKITKSKRQTSNIRSAEICRAAKGLYVKRLEGEILHEEEVYLQMMRDMLDQSAENVRLEQRIAYLEEQCNIKEAQRSCARLRHVQSAETDDVVDEFFPASRSDGTRSQWDTYRDGGASAWDGDIELCDADEDAAMDFNEVNAPMTPPPPREVSFPVTPQKENRCPNEYTKNILRSPVSIFDLETELEGSLSLKL